MLVRSDGSFVSLPIVVSGVQYPPNIEALWSDDELAAIGLRRVLPDSAVAADEKSQGKFIGAARAALRAMGIIRRD
jgi:hypothetical protein